MIRRLARHITYERFAFAFTGLCILTLYILVASNPGKDAVEGKPQAVPQRTDAVQPVPAIAAPAKKSAVDKTVAEKIVARAAPAAKAAGVTQAARRKPASVSARIRSVPVVAKPIIVRPVGSPEKITEMFRRIGYNLPAIRERGEVPRVFLAFLPSDLHKIRPVDRRKMVFIQTALPLILHVNELILNDRARILMLRDQERNGAKFALYDRAWLEGKTLEYGLTEFSYNALLRRVDSIPPSLALAQSAEESGWGTSRFAREGNALFGQRIWGPGAGMVPKERETGAKFQVRAFGHLIDGVKSYARNLNSHRAYRKFRKTRSLARRNGKIPGGDYLAGTLKSYSERGAAYVKTIRTIIRSNRFEKYDTVRLGDKITPDPDA